MVRWLGRSGFRAVLMLLPFVAVVPVVGQPDVLIEKSTNGQDADSPPGPVLLVGLRSPGCMWSPTPEPGT